jgi:hypothetical protein
MGISKDILFFNYVKAFSRIDKMSSLIYIKTATSSTHRSLQLGIYDIEPALLKLLL